MDNIRDLINLGIQKKISLRIEYRGTYDPVVTTKIIIPTGWYGGHMIYAYSHTDSRNLQLLVTNILACTVYEGGEIDIVNAKPVPANPRILSGSDPAKPDPRHVATSKKADKQPASKGEPFNTVETPKHWGQLLQYYRECLVIENQQKYILNPNSLIHIDLSLDLVQNFILGSYVLEYPTSSRLIKDILENKNKGKNSQLCIGYPFFVLPDQRLAPLIMASVTVLDQNPEMTTLVSENLSISYAALKGLELEDKEIEDYLSEFEALNLRERFSFREIEEFVFQKIASVLFPEQIDISLNALPLYRTPGYFWVEQEIATRSLIKELNELSLPHHWRTAPLGMRSLLNTLSENDTTFASPSEEDSLFVTAMNESQVQAATNAKEKSFTVVTGPPGTGKSQLVLNIIANAVYNGEKVLFASRNNKAVDVVMNRLNFELSFPGAVRTGNRKIMAEAGQHMKKTIEAIRPGVSGDVTSVIEEYTKTKKSISEAKNELHLIRDQKNLLESYRQELKDYEQRLPELIISDVRKYAPELDPREIDQLLTRISQLLDEVQSLINSEREAIRQVMQIFSGEDNVVHLCIRSYENQHGQFSGGYFVSPIETVQEAHERMKVWKQLTSTLELGQVAGKTYEAYINAQENLKTSLRQLNPVFRSFAQDNSKKFEPWEIKVFLQGYSELEAHFRSLIARKPNLVVRILKRLNIYDPAAKSRRRFARYAMEIEAKSNNSEIDLKPETLRQYHDATCLLVSTFETIQLINTLDKATVAYQDALSSYQNNLSRLPAEVQTDARSLNLREKISAQDKDILQLTEQQLLQIIKQYGDNYSRINELIDKNIFNFSILTAFKGTPAGQNLGLWRMSRPEVLDNANKYLRTWTSLLGFWKTLENVRQVERKLEGLPAESHAVELIFRLEQEFVEISRSYLRQVWESKAALTGNEQIQRCIDFSDALMALSQYNKATYQSAKSAQDQFFPDALELFPVWATTNLSARTNFPLKSGLFDLVIIDEASQCDISSALPLLYRGKRAVIIGDPHQLRHIATINVSSEEELTSRYGIPFGRFLYSRQSLFDLANSVVGKLPGTVLLNEHYRSDARVISFSNQEFYNNRLLIKTDLTTRGYRKSFLNQYGGTYWLNVDGRTQKPDNGRSAFNVEEEKGVIALIQELTERLPDFGPLLAESSIGVVTPFRLQEENLSHRINNRSGKIKHIEVGTAHRYQGGEMDFIIFSPVISNGILNGTKKWLENTYNLLNVALTRARIGLFIVGNWDFCRQLPAQSHYRRLADHVAFQQDRLFRRLEDMPILRKMDFDITGYILDPHNPEFNRTTLIRFLRSCKEHFWWVDNYFDSRVFDLLIDVFETESPSTQEIRLLTSTNRFQSEDGNRPAIKLEKARFLQSELQKLDIRFEIRALAKKEIPHDRFLFLPNKTINMPPFGGAIGKHLHVSEYTSSAASPELFTELWDRAIHMEVLTN